MLFEVGGCVCKDVLAFRESTGRKLMRRYTSSWDIDNIARVFREAGLKLVYIFQGCSAGSKALLGSLLLLLQLLSCGFKVVRGTRREVDL